MPIKFSHIPKASKTSAFVAAILIQSLFSILYCKHFAELNQSLLEKHATVISTSLWQYDTSTPLPYLKLAMASENYHFLEAKDDSGNFLISLSQQPKNWLSQWLSHRLPQMDVSYQTQIFYENRAIGTLLLRTTVAPIIIANLLFFIALLFIGFMLKIVLRDQHYKYTLKNYASQLKTNNDALIKAMNAAEAASQSKDTFLANMSHEIRTPMNGVVGIAELLGTTNLNDQQLQYVRTIQKSSNILLSVINDILDLSKIDSGKMEIIEKTFNLRELIEDLTLPFTLNPKPSVTFTTAVDSNVPTHIKTDEVRLQQIINNLLNNAFKFTSSGHIRLTITAVPSDRKNTLQILVEDSGIGISEESQQLLFSPFSQADKNTSHKYGGTGLGLTICKRLCNLLDGDIRVASKPRQGTTFTVELPLIIPDTLPNPSVNDNSVAPASNHLWSGRSVLIVEDHPVNQLVITGLLEALNIIPTTANNGKEALALLSNNDARFDLILMDCEMPVMDGYDATRAIRQWETEKQLKPHLICALTAHAMPNQAEKCEAAGMNHYLSKPIRLAELETYLGDNPPA